jgi:hypothetical protein
MLMPQRTAQLSQDLLNAIQEEGPKLRAISEADSETRSGGGSGWSRKQELGHLIDSATNNRVRFAAAALSGAYAGPTYDGEGWVTLGGYQSMPWNTVLDLWSALNTALATLIANIREERLTVHCQVGGGVSVTLDFLIEDYILHMQHHLDHLLGREVSTSYPGAAMGV